MKIRSLTLAAALVAATTAYAEDLALPMEDVDAPDYCGSNSYRERGVKRACMDQVQEGYDYLKAVWDDTSDEIKRFCLKTQRGKDIRIEMPRYKYLIMAECVLRQRYVEDLKTPRTFRR